MDPQNFVEIARIVFPQLEDRLEMKHWNGIADKVEIDPYGHRKLLPAERFREESSLFVGEASVSYELIGTTESYWLQDDLDNGRMSALWRESGELPGELFCGVVSTQLQDVERSERALYMLGALWFSRAPYAVSLNEFRRDGLISHRRLEQFIEMFHRQLEPPHVPDDAPVSFAEVFYDDGSLRYRGEQYRGIAHGRGKGYWTNGKVWCDGFFKHDKPHGNCRIYYKDGTLRHEGEFCEGLPRGEGKEYFPDGQLKFEGIYGRQGPYFNWGARIYVKGRLYDEDGNLEHDGEFKSDGKRSWPLRE